MIDVPKYPYDRYHNDPVYHMRRVEMNAKYSREHRGEINERYRARYMKRCGGLKGVCGILNKHHTMLKDDPERLTTKFLQNLIGVDHCD